MLRGLCNLSSYLLFVASYRVLPKSDLVGSAANIPEIRLFIDGDNDGKINKELAKPSLNLWHEENGRVTAPGAIALVAQESDDILDPSAQLVTPLEVRINNISVGHEEGFIFFATSHGATVEQSLLRCYNGKSFIPLQFDEGFAVPLAGARSTVVNCIVEGVSFPRDAFVDFTHIVVARFLVGEANVTSNPVHFRISPCLFSSNDDVAMNVVVSRVADLTPRESDSSQVQFAAEVKTTLAMTGANTTVVDGVRFMQDVAEVGVQTRGHVDASAYCTILFPARMDFFKATFATSFKAWEHAIGKPKHRYDVRLALGPELWCTFNAGGNHETTPPLEGYPYGRVLLGAADGPDTGPPPQVWEFVNGMGKQPALFLDTSWLYVGHVDEAVHVVSTSKGNLRAIIPDAQGGIDLMQLFFKLYATSEENGCDLSKQMITAPDKFKFLNSLLDPTTKKRIEKDTRAAIQHVVELQEQLASGLKGHELERLAEQEKFDDARQMMADLFIKLPIIFTRTRTEFKTFLPNSVNMVSVGKTHVISYPQFANIPKTPACAKHFDVPENSAVRDFFGFHVSRALLHGLGLDHEVKWVNGDVLHEHNGDVHCGSNVVRVPKNLDWWASTIDERKDDPTLSYTNNHGAFREENKDSWCPGSMNEMIAELQM